MEADLGRQIVFVKWLTSPGVQRSFSGWMTSETGFTWWVGSSINRSFLSSSVLGGEGAAPIIGRVSQGLSCSQSLHH